MKDMLWQLCGAVPIPDGVSDNEALDRIEDLLEEQRKPGRRISDRQVMFDCPLWYDVIAPNWHALVIFDRGGFWTGSGSSGRELKYDLRCFQLLVVCAFGGLIAAFPNLTNGDSGAGARTGLFAFVWLYGLNIVLAWMRVRGTIERAVRGGN